MKWDLIGGFHSKAYVAHENGGIFGSLKGEGIGGSKRQEFMDDR